MDVNAQIIKNIIRYLNYLKSQVADSNSINLTDINIHAENFYRDLLNLVYDWKLSNMNSQTQNAAHIDLIDKKNKIAIQVTSKNDKKKIIEAIEGFYSTPRNADYSFKVLLIAKKAKTYKTDFTVGGKYNFDHKKDVIDTPRLLKDIQDKNTDEIKAIADFLEKEVLLPRPKTESNEVETIMELLEYLSDDNNYKEFDEEYECDPDKKINSKFKVYSDNFKDEFVELYPLYYLAVLEAEKSFGLDGVRAKKVSNFLIRISNRHLREANNNPLVAMDSLTDFFEHKVNENGIKSDNGAIRYYLLDELIGCNIFSTQID